MKAIWKDSIIAESDRTIVVENNHYFPKESVDQSYLQESDKTSTCPWKGKAHYYTIKVDGKVNEDAAWYYPDPKLAAKEIKDHVAFWKGVEVVK